MNSILVIHPYFGKFPDIFPFWLKSCILNSSIDFLIVTDQNIDTDSLNIHVLKTTLPNIKNRIEYILNMPVWLEKPYKLCDFRPIYGMIFSEYTKNYDFWGYCDCDLIFGDIRYFLTEEVLNNYDYILGWGHFHIQRTNDIKYENVWKSARGLWRDINWKQVFQSDKNEWFDELPYGVSGRYYEMYPNRCWMGYKDNQACFESPTPSKLTFKSLFNNYKLWQTWDGYQKHLKRLPFLFRTKGNELNNILFYKDGIKLFKKGTNELNQIKMLPILYVHFYKRNLIIKTKNRTNYLIHPDAIIESMKINWINLYYYSHHPSIYLKYFIYWLKRKYDNIKLIFFYEKKNFNNNACL